MNWLKAWKQAAKSNAINLRIANAQLETWRGIAKDYRKKYEQVLVSKNVM